MFSGLFKTVLESSKCFHVRVHITQCSIELRCAVLFNWNKEVNEQKYNVFYLLAYRDVQPLNSVVFSDE